MISPIPQNAPLLIYLAGPLAPTSEHTTTEHIYKAREWAAHMYQTYENILIVSPHLNSGWAYDTVIKPDKEEHIIKANKRLLARCDVLYLLPGWQKSKGCQAELEIAKSIGIPTFEIGIV